MHYNQRKPLCLNILKKFVGKLYALLLAFEVKASASPRVSLVIFIHIM